MSRIANADRHSASALLSCDHHAAGDVEHRRNRRSPVSPSLRPSDTDPNRAIRSVQHRDIEWFCDDPPRHDEERPNGHAHSLLLCSRRDDSLDEW